MFHSNKNILRKFLDGILIKLLSLATSYLYVLFVTKIYGVQTWGMVALTIALINVLSSVGKFGLDISALKYASIHSDFMGKVKSIYFKSFKLILIITSIISLAIYFTSLFLLDHAEYESVINVMVMTSLCLIPYSITALNGQILRSLGKTRTYFFYVDLFKTLLPLLFTILFFTVKFKSELILWTIGSSYTLGFMLSTASVLFTLKGYHSIPTMRSKDLIKISRSLFFASAGVLFIGWTDTIIIGILDSAENTGTYDIIFKISQVSSISLIAVNAFIAPMISKYYHLRNMEEMRNLLFKISKLLSFVSLITFLVFAVFYSPIFSLFDLAIENTTTISYYLLIFSQCLNTFFGPVALILQLTGDEKYYSKVIWSVVTLNILLNILLIHVLGITGAALASLLSMFIWNILTYLRVKRLYQISTIYIPGISKQFKSK